MLRLCILQWWLEAHEYQYNADAFEARGGADVKVGTAEKVSKVREDKAR